MATTLKAFQQEISSISDQKKAEHLRDLRQQAQQAAQHHGKSSASSAAKAGGQAKVKPATKEKVVKVDEVKVGAGAGDDKGNVEDGDDAAIDVPDVSIEVRVT